MFLTLVVSSCANVHIKDQTWYGNLGDQGAVEFHTLKDETKEIAPDEWKKISFGMLCTTPKTFAENKENILQLCVKNPRCKIEEVKKIFENIESFEVYSEQLP